MGINLRRKEKGTMPKPTIINITQGVKFVKELQTMSKSKEDFLKILSLQIADIYNMHDNGERLTAKNTFIIGLRYSEFLATSSTQEAYTQAEHKRQWYLTQLGITVPEINHACLTYANLH